MSNQGMEKSSTGLDANVAALLVYLPICGLSIVLGLVFFLIEKESGFVRFHAMQSILLSAGLIIAWIVFWVVSIILGMIVGILGTLFSLLSFLIGLGALAIFILMMIKAYQGEVYKLPFIGDMAENIVNK